MALSRLEQTIVALRPLMFVLPPTWLFIVPQGLAAPESALSDT